MNHKEYGFEIIRLLNQWQVCLFVSHNIKPIDNYVSVNKEGKYNLVYVFKREDVMGYMNKFKRHELEIGDFVTKFEDK